MLLKTNPPQLNKILKNLPLIILIFIAVYSFKGYEKHSEFEDVFKQQKKDLQVQLDRMIADYKKMSLKKKSNSKRLIKEMNKIIALKKSVKEIKKENYSLITKYTRKIVKLERENRTLFLQVDSLFKNNEQLQIDNNIVKEQLKTETQSYNTLLKENETLLLKEEKLNEKIKDASILIVKKINTVAVKETRKGKFKDTSKAKRTDAFKIQFNLPLNLVAKSGKKNVLIQVIDKNNNVLNPKESTTRKGEKIWYSDSVIVDYENEELGIVSLISVDRNNIMKGKYTIIVYVDEVVSGTTKIELN